MATGENGPGGRVQVHVLVVSGGAAWARVVVPTFEREGYVVRATDAGGLSSAPPAPSWDVAVIDLSVDPDLARTTLTSLRSNGAGSIVAVARPDAREAAVVAAYADGADHVLCHPLRAREVVARVRALLRRQPRRPTARTLQPPSSAARVSVDVVAGVAVVDGRKVELTRAEAAVLQALVLRQGGVVTRGELLVEAHGESSRSLDSIVRCLRTKLEAVEGSRRIVVVRGIGFRLAEAPVESPARTAI